MKRSIAGIATLAAVLSLLCGIPGLAYAAPSDVSGYTTLTTVADGTSVAQQALIKAKTSWPWYVTRAAGIIASILLLLLILSGIGQITGLTYRVVEPLAAWRLHRALAIAFGGSVIVHVVALLFDKFAPFTIWQVLLPFMSHYMPISIGGWHVGSLYVALGIFALYAAAVVIVTSLVWMDKKPFWWRLMHYLSYLLVVLIFLHGLFIGTDIRNGILRIVWYACGVIILAGIISRLRRARTINRHKDEP